MKNKKYLVVVLLVILVIVVLALAWKSSKQNAGTGAKPVANSQNSQTQTPKAPSPLALSAATVPSAQIPAGMPANLPFENNAKILSNFTIKNPDTGKTQATRTYVSQKTIDENFAIYQKYLQDNGWTITSSLSKPSVKSLDSAKGATNLNVVIGQDSKGQVSVMVTYIE
jgi:hypothetical protein